MFHRALPRFGLLAVATIAALATAAGSAAAVETADEPSSDLLVSVMPDPVLITGVTPMTVDVGIGLGSVPRDAALILDISRLHGVDVLLGSTGCTRERTRITCTWPGQTFPFVTGRQLVFPLRRTHNAQAGPAGTVTATVRSASPDPEPGNNTQTVAVAIADTGVGLVASVGPIDQLTPGTSGPVRWSVTNRGVAATAVTALLTAPPLAAFFDPPAGCVSSIDGRTLTCPLGDLAAGGSVTGPQAQITVLPNAPSFASIGRVALIVTGSPAPGSPPSRAGSRNFDESSLATKERVADLLISAVPASGRVGETVAVNFGIANRGPSETPYTFGFTLPTGTQFVSAPDICAPVSPSEYRCTPAEPASAGGPAFFGTLSLRITEPSVGADGAFTVTGEAVDPDLSNNTGPIQITVTA